VLSHELGHEFTSRQGTLFSPFATALAHVTNRENQRRWGTGHVRQPEEEAANLWGANELIPEEEWNEVEGRYPTCLKSMAKTLDLPVAAALWRARAMVQKNGAQQAQVNLDPATLEVLLREVRGQGGHQSFARSLQRAVKGATLTLTRADFNRIREYRLNVGGGFGKIYRTLMSILDRSISETGGIESFFGSNPSSVKNDHLEKLVQE